MIRFRCTDTPIQKAGADVVALPVWRTDARTRVPGSSELHKTLDRLCRADGFGAQPGETFLYHAPPKHRNARHMLRYPTKVVCPDSSSACPGATDLVHW